MWRSYEIPPGGLPLLLAASPTTAHDLGAITGAQKAAGLMQRHSGEMIISVRVTNRFYAPDLGWINGQE